MPQQFASDNNAGMCPEALEALIAENARGHDIGYGDDQATARAVDAIRDVFETDCDVFFAFNGTAANALLLAQICRSYNAVIAHAFSHIEMDEAGAPGFFSGGASLMTADTPAGKLTPTAVEQLATRFEGVHHVKVKALSLTQSTELGTVYTVNELRALSEAARRHGLKVHMDGARFANAAASLGVTPAEMTWRAGIDVLSFGGVKNGLAVGECMVFFDAALAEGFAWRVKQAGHLNSKMRLVTAPWHAVLSGGHWLRHAAHANAMAQRLAKGLATIPGTRLLYPVEANAVFVDIPQTMQQALREKGWSFYTFLPPTGCRLMCAWDTETGTVDQYIADLWQIASSAS